jgi:hypothetical protein
MKEIVLLGMLLNQMVVACIEIDGVEQVANLFQKVKIVLEETCKPHHLNNFNVSTNLVGSYNVLIGRYTQTTCIWCLSHGSQRVLMSM